MANKLTNKIYPVILAGGSGTRLWPLSRELSPKQLLEIKDNVSLIKMSVDRCKHITDNAPTIVTTAKQLVNMKIELTGAKVKYITEPSAKNTAPAIALATAIICRDNPEAIMAILPSDHFLDEKALARAIKKAAEVSEKEKVITLIGIKPTRPETGYGYIQIDDQKTETEDVYKVCLSSRIRARNPVTILSTGKIRLAGLTGFNASCDSQRYLGCDLDKALARICPLVNR